MCDGATATEPERILVQLLTDTLRFQCVLTPIEWLQHSERGAHECVVGKHAAEADRTFVGVDGNKCVNAVVGT